MSRYEVNLRVTAEVTVEVDDVVTESEAIEDAVTVIDEVLNKSTSGEVTDYDLLSIDSVDTEDEVRNFYTDDLHWSSLSEDEDE